MKREDKGRHMPSADENAPTGANAENTSSLAARRARLRGSLARASANFASDSGTTGTETMETQEPAPPLIEMPQAPEVNEVAAPVATNFDQLNQLPDFTQAAIAPEPEPSAPVIPVAATPTPKEKEKESSKSSSSGSHAKNQPLPQIPDSAIKMLTNIDQALDACATNLAALQRLAIEQTDVLKNLTTTLQNQTMVEVGLNLNNLTESLSAALEPMKAIGELVPAMDSLVSTLEGQAVEPEKRLSRDQLVTSLADQLSAGVVDSWTFKCAYMAIYPDDHPADLLHRLVELLGTQRLSSDLFRAAYEAVQGAKAPAGSTLSAAQISQIDDESVKAQINELAESNRQLRLIQDKREKEVNEMIKQKDKELFEAQARLNAVATTDTSVAEGKIEAQYKELLDTKEMEIVEKDSELNLLRTQMEDLKGQTEQIIQDLQEQLADLKKAQVNLNSTPQVAAAPVQAATPVAAAVVTPAKPTTGFFDVNPLMAQVTFDPAPVNPETKANIEAEKQAEQQRTSQTNVALQSVQTGGPSTTGSYGSGVRAQVFEVIVRQALAGAPWREICAGPMQVNNISPDEVEAEVKKRRQ